MSKNNLTKSSSELGKRFKSLIYKSNNNKIDLLNILKSQYSFQQIKNIIPEIISHPLANKFIYGTALPKTYAELNTGIYSLTSDLEHELNWNLFSITKYRNEINKFLSEKTQFENELLLGKYSKANQTLSKISKICHSNWELENRFLIEELQGGLEKNKEFLSKINEDNIDSLLALIIHFYSNRAEKKISFTRYSALVNAYINEDFSENFRDYLSFKLNYFNVKSIANIEWIISIEEKSSIFDKYLIQILVCQEIICNKKDYNNYTQYAIHSLEILKRYIQDPIIDKLLLINNPDHQYDLHPYDEAIIELFDLYTCGNYESVLGKLKEAILLYPNDFSLYKLYVKSLLYLNREFRPIDDQKSITNDILEDAYNISSKKELTGQSISRLLKTACCLQSVSISHQLFSFCADLSTDIDVNKSIVNGFVRSTLINPGFYQSYDDSNDSINYLNSLQKLNPDSTTIKFFLELNHKLQSGIVSEISTKNVSETRKSFYKAQVYQKLTQFKQAIDEYEKLITSEINDSLFEETIINLFICYFKLKDYNRCISLYVDNFLKNNNIILRINVGDIHKKIEATRFKDVEHNIKLPIFSYITKQDNHTINVALRIFLKIYGITKPSELKDIVDSFDKNYLKFLLLYICTPEILKYSTLFHSTKEILTERLNVLQILNGVETRSANFYKDDIRRVTQNLAIIDGVREVDESKIFVDIKGLANNEFSEIETNFNRYIEISKLIDEKPYIFVDLINNKKILLKFFSNIQTEKEQQEARMAKNFKFDLFKELFIEIGERFLFSNKYGLDSYLSTRIRHGTLLGQIRSEFQNQHLITQKDNSKEEYFPNAYWTERLELSSDVNTKIQKLLARFSLEIDTIANNLKEKAIQIRSSKNSDYGLFDYIFNTKTLEYYYQHFFEETTNYHEFIDGVFVILWQKTKTNLEIIQDHISRVIRDQIVTLLNNLEKDTRSIFNDSRDIQELLNCIINCRIHMMNELDKIAEWFSLKENIVADFTVEKVIDTAIEITNKVSQTNKILSKPDIQSSTLIKGEYFIHFFDLLRIFFENATNYSNLSTEYLDFAISVQESEGTLHITIKNNLSDGFNLEELRSKFEMMSVNLDRPDWDMEKIKKEVGGTGFYKAKNILSTHLKNESNQFSFFINKENYVEIDITVSLNEIKL